MFFRSGEKAGLTGALPFAAFGGDCGAVGIGTWTWAVLSCIPVGACACGAEGRMASIGPLALGAKGCIRFAQGAAAVEGAFRCALLWKTFTTALRAMEIPPLVANAPTFPPLRGGTTTRAYCSATYEESVSRCFILPPE